MILIDLEKDLIPVAAQLLSRYGHATVWCFKGEMGVGKTALIKQLCVYLGAKGSLSSPSFSIVNEYETKSDKVIYHFDFYRIKNLTEACDIGAEEYFFSSDYCFIEWPEIVKPLLPDSYIEILLNLVDGNRREINVIEHGKK